MNLLKKGITARSMSLRMQIFAEFSSKDAVVRFSSLPLVCGSISAFSIADRSVSIQSLFLDRMTESSLLCIGHIVFISTSRSLSTGPVL